MHQCVFICVCAIMCSYVCDYNCVRQDMYASVCKGLHENECVCDDASVSLPVSVFLVNDMKWYVWHVA